MVLIAALVCPVSVRTSLAHRAYSVEAGWGLVCILKRGFQASVGCPNYPPEASSALLVCALWFLS